MNGFETEILERHSQPGGLCTSWKRDGFTFDGCLQWLLGSNESSPYYRLWSELLDMKSIAFINHEVRLEIELNENRDRHGDKVFHLYTNISRLESYLCDLAPEDTGMIKSLIRSMRMIQRFEVPPMIDNNTAIHPMRQRLAMVKYFPLLFWFMKWRNVTNYSFARKLSNPFLKEAFRLLFDGEEFKLLILTMPLSFFDTGGAGYPVGGSFQFANKIAEKYIALGGNIHYNHDVKKILTEGNKAVGILLKDNRVIRSDVTISAADWHFTVFEALEGKFVNSKLRALALQKKLKIYPSIVLVSLGVSRTYGDLPHFFRFPVETPVLSPDGTAYDRIETHIYHYDPTLAPEGKTVVALCFYTRNGDYWIDLRGKDRLTYDRKKNEFAREVLDRLEEKMAGIKQVIEYMDIATPATYHRYTNNWKGSIQGWFPESNLIASSPVGTELPGLTGFYFCNHWSIPGGGLPVSVKAARDLAYKICVRHKRPFKTR
jgi:phytoene dehydrogenase-like protein